ncbi:hypothetical protein ACLB2K_067853 [Fragaria x ananassa]
MAETVAAAPRSSMTKSYVDNMCKEDARQANILAARTVADAIRTRLGPKGMDKNHKMISTASGDVIIITNDGTSTVVVIVGALLKQCLVLLSHGIHPTVLSDSLHKIAINAVDVLTAMACTVELSDRDALVKSVLNSKVVSQYSTLLAPQAVDAVLSVVDPAKPEIVDLRDIKIVKKLGGTVDDTETVKGLVFDKKTSHDAGGPTRMEKAKIAVIQFQISPPKTDILSMIKKIKSTGCNVLLIQKSILRDAGTDLSLHYLAKAKILVIKDVERDEIEFITKTLNCLHAHCEYRAFPQGEAGNMGRTTSVLVRGSNQLVLDEAERSLHDALQREPAKRAKSAHSHPLFDTGTVEAMLARHLLDFVTELGAIQADTAFVSILDRMPLSPLAWPQWPPWMPSAATQESD